MDKKNTDLAVNLILSIKRRYPHYGVRLISKILEQEHGIKVSKSWVYNILKQRKKKLLKRRISSLYLNQGYNIGNCAPFVLLLWDSWKIGIVSYLHKELRVFFPRIKDSILNKLVVYFISISFSKTVDKDKILRLPKLSNKYIDAFRAGLQKNKPIVDFKTLKRRLKIVSLVRFIFYNRDIVYCDPKFNTFWEKHCLFSQYHTTIYEAENIIDQFSKTGIFFIKYTKSFQRLSYLAVNFIRGLESGVKKIQLLNQQGEIIAERMGNPEARHFFIGYHPKNLSSSIEILQKPKRQKKLKINLNEDIFYTQSMARFLASSKGRDLVLNNIFLYKVDNFPFWGVVTNLKDRFLNPLKQYIYSFPYPDRYFSEDMNIFENVFIKKNMSPVVVGGNIPEYLEISGEDSFRTISYLIKEKFRSNFGENSDFYLKKGKIVDKGKIVSIYLSGQESPEKMVFRAKFNRENVYFKGRKTLIL